MAESALADRLRSALDEAERIAQAATSWRVTFGATKAGVRHRLIEFANANDPAHVLRTIQAHRKILELHAGSHECSQFDDRGDIDRCTWVLDDETCSTLAAVASIYFPEGTE